MSSLLHHRSILWALDRFIARKNHIRLLGASSPINPTQRSGARGPFQAAAAMVEVLVVFLRPLEGILNPLYVLYLKI